MGISHNSKRASIEALEDITTSLRNLLNGHDYLNIQSPLFSSFLNQIYISMPKPKDLYPLGFVMDWKTNVENLKDAFTIIKKKGWAQEGYTWNHRNIFSSEFVKLAVIPIFLPTIYPGVVSAVFLLFLLYPDKEAGLRFYSGLGKKKSAREIILNDAPQEVNTLKEMYVGIRTAHKEKKSPYLAKMEQNLHVSFAIFLPLSFSKKEIPSEEYNDLFLALEAYDYVSHMDDHRPHKRYFSNPPLFNDEMREIVFKTIVLILAYQKDASTVSSYHTKLHAFIGTIYQFHLVHDVCIMLSKSIVAFSTYTSCNDSFSQEVARKILGQIVSNLDNFLLDNKELLHPERPTCLDSSSLTIERPFLFFTILWAIERNSAIRKMTFNQQIWYLLDDMDQAVVDHEEFYDQIRRVFLQSLKGPREGLVPNPIYVDNWDAFYKKYREETDIICSGIDAKHDNKKDIWERSITALLLVENDNLNASRERTVHFLGQMFTIPPSDVHTTKKLTAWRTKNPDNIRLLSLPWVWSMMILYIVSTQIYVKQNGHDTKFFSTMINPSQASKKSKKCTLRFYIDNMYRHPPEEVEDLKQVLLELIEISPQKWCFPFSFKEKWLTFITETSEALSLYLDAVAYHYIEPQPYQSIDHSIDASKELLVRIFNLINKWLSYMHFEKDNPLNMPDRIYNYLKYSLKHT